MKMLMDEIGEVTFQKNQRSKNLRITVKPFKGIKVTMPYTVSYNSAISFVQEKKDWLKKSLTYIRQIENKFTVYDESTIFRTKYHEIKILPNRRNEYCGFTKNGIFYFYYPPNQDVRSDMVQNNIKKGITWVLRKEAKSYLPFRVMHLAEKHGFKYETVFVKNIKTRWGSCSYKNNINLNIHLMRLPDHLIDYVILHELAHTIHKNHGKDFWKCLNLLCGDALALRKEMRNYSILL